MYTNTHILYSQENDTSTWLHMGTRYTELAKRLHHQSKKYNLMHGILSMLISLYHKKLKILQAIMLYKLKLQLCGHIHAVPNKHPRHFRT